MIACATRSSVAVVGFRPRRRNRYRPVTSDRNEKRNLATQPSPVSASTACRSVERRRRKPVSLLARRKPSRSKATGRPVRTRSPWISSTTSTNRVWVAGTFTWTAPASMARSSRPEHWLCTNIRDWIAPEAFGKSTDSRFARTDALVFAPCISPTQSWLHRHPTYPRCEHSLLRRVGYILEAVLRRVGYSYPRLSTQSWLHNPIKTYKRFL